MPFRPSALSNPQQVLTYKPKMPTTRVLQRPIPKPSVSLQPINLPSAGEDKGEEKEEGLPQWAKVLIGVGVAGVLGYGVVKLIGK
jgi:hypothetical protein